MLIRNDKLMIWLMVGGDWVKKMRLKDFHVEWREISEGGVENWIVKKLTERYQRSSV